MAITPKGTGARLGGGKLPAKAYSEYSRPGRNSNNYSNDVRSDAKIRKSSMDPSILFKKDEEDDDETNDLRRIAMKRRLKKLKKQKGN